MKLFQEEIDERLTLDDLNLFEGDGENILWSILSPSNSSASALNGENNNAGDAQRQRARSELVETKDRDRDIIDDNGNASRARISQFRTSDHRRAAEILPALEHTSVKKVMSARPPSASPPTSSLQPLTPPSSPGTLIILQAVSNLI